MGRIPCTVSGPAAQSLKSTERLKTRDFLAIEALLSTMSSYRRNNDLLNLMTRRSKANGNLINTFTEYEESVRIGETIQTSFNQLCRDILQENGIVINDTGEVTDHTSLDPITEGIHRPVFQLNTEEELPDDAPRQLRELHDFVAEHNSKHAKPTQIHGLHTFEDPGRTVYISVDDVLVHKQNRKVVYKNGQECVKSTEEWIYHSVAYIEVSSYVGNGADRKLETKVYMLEASTQAQAYSNVLAFLLYNSLTDYYLVFFADGEETLKTIPNQIFSNWPHVVYMDYYHLEERMKETFSRAFKPGKIIDDSVSPEYFKNGKVKKSSVQKITRSKYYLRLLISMLWSGNVNHAKEWLNSMKTSNELKPGGESIIESALQYLNRKEDRFPCYILRAKLKLRNTSNSVEIANNILVARRQKKNGTAWCNLGSFACSESTCIFINEESENYFRKKIIHFTPRKKAEDNGYSSGLSWLHNEDIRISLSDEKYSIELLRAHVA